MQFGLDGKVVVITGGSRGIGKAAALRFAAEGARVAITGRTREDLECTQRELAAAGTSALAHVADIADRTACESAIQSTIAAFGRIDVLVNNAGGPSHHGSFFEHSEDILMSRLNIKTLGAMRMSRIIVPHMQQVGGGRIICIGGSSVRRPSPDSLVAGISNAALSNFTKHLSDIVASDGILVNVVHPSTTITSTWQSLIGNRAQNMSVSETEAISTLAATFPIGRIPDADDVAPLIVFLASDLARAITGQSIVVDGGKVRSVAY